MANGKKETEKMAKTVDLKITNLSPKQKVMNLDTNEETEITVTSQRFEAPDYDEALYASTEEFETDLLHTVMALVTPKAKQIEAFLKYATSESYQSGKSAALATGNFMSSELRGRLVQIMRGNNAFAEMSASDAYKYWLNGYKEKKPGALKLLKTAQDSADIEF